ncbi:MAG: TIGR03960 family B12-binding radical SAM protein, partial [Nitrospirae bacterium]|nr:TIGR03960 family B12-binding radical SAM protein [Nitrospirota bacterium]
MNLLNFSKPSRYINCEINSIRKEISDERGSIRAALSFPDIYEVGMSHLGMKILYGIINRIPFASAERVFAPWTDLEGYMIRNNIPLSSLESNTPLSKFDIVGFSLQYELSYTTVLNMLRLGGIPLRSDERLDLKGHLPLVIAGGPCTVNPAPMSAFIDAFLIGDGEDAIVELIETARQWKLNSDGKRGSFLKEISRLEGLYVPSVHKTERIKRRFVYDLNKSFYPTKPVVPYTSIVHDRINIEVSRGCDRGCRFCQAGMIYRPLRERSPEVVLGIAEESLRNTGYSEVSLTSLSAGDYSCLLPVVREFNKRFSRSRTALSLPSLRVGAVNQEVIREIKSVRKTGFTMAPEAATERLRNVINKDFSDEDYEKALNALFSEGWQNLKLYFMIGLPSEREEDIEAIPHMALKALKTAKKKTSRFVNISATISPFIPKSHTSFQWIGQLKMEEIQKRLAYLRERLSSKKIKFKGHNSEMSLIEAVFARGDEGLSVLLEEAWKSGCRLDGWSEVFNFKGWLDSMERTGIDGYAYAERAIGFGERLPWDNIDTGIKKEFMLMEYEQALRHEISPACSEKCSVCGLKCGPDFGAQGAKDIIAESIPFGSEIRIQSPVIIKIRVQFSKTGMLRYLSHLELV